jgi:Flp pilus assembly protein TadG
MGNFWGRWVREERATTAVEFSMIGIPFVLMIVGIVEMALMFTVQSIIQQATFDAARLIRTGQLQQGELGDPEQAFRQAVCDFAELVVPCAEIQYQVEKLDNFSDADDNPPEFDEEGNMEDTPFDPGVENDIVLIRVAYNFPIRTPMMKPLLATVDGTKRSIFSTIILQTEPYQQ